MRREKLPTMSDLMSLFKRLDRNGDGYLSADELRHILTKVHLLHVIVNYIFSKSINES